MTDQTKTELHAFLHKELPATTAELQERLDLLHRMMPGSFKHWPTDARAALDTLRADGLVFSELGEWRWAAKAQKVERCLF